MTNKTLLIGDLPQITEVIVDLGIGIFVIFLFSPFVYALFLFMTGNPSDSNFFIMIFPETWKLFSNIGIGAGLLGLFFAYVLGIASRSVLFLTMSFLRAIKSGWIEEKIFLGFIYRILECQYGKNKLEFNKEDIKDNLIDKGLFCQVGDSAYSCFRSELARSGSYLNKHKSYWDHEAFMCFLFERLYSLFLTFLFFYFVYGLILIIYLLVNSKALIPGLVGGVLIWIISFIIVVSLYKEMVFHGMAFVTINDILFKLFINNKEANKWVEYKKVIKKTNV
ncbi:MAG: hypothetical protein JSW06_00120 [Thermoplasmatales archaeon]|nr:MAG: hypothetical protein JSW06_00120 [Thermoplasmatales archaeon]